MHPTTIVESLLVMKSARNIDRLSSELRKKFLRIFGSLFYSFITLNVVVIGILVLSFITIEEINSFDAFTSALRDPPSDWITAYILVFMFNVMFIRLCCTNRAEGVLPLSPDGFSLLAQ
jgi:hypothetical protein